MQSVTKLELISRSEAKHEFFMSGKKYCRLHILLWSPRDCCPPWLQEEDLHGCLQSRSQPHRSRTGGTVGQTSVSRKAVPEKRAMGCCPWANITLVWFCSPFPHSIGSYSAGMEKRLKVRQGNKTGACIPKEKLWHLIKKLRNPRVNAMIKNLQRFSLFFPKSFKLTWKWRANVGGWSVEQNRDGLEFILCFTWSLVIFF